MNRLLYLDWLRVFAAFGVVIIHVTAGYVGVYNQEQGLRWIVGNFFESLTRWAVPIFVMISGALLLRDQRELSFWEFLKKRASKVIIPFVGWSILFYLYGAYKGYFPVSLKQAIKYFINNGITYHFWFFYMIIGIYLITPLLKLLVTHAKRHHLEYFLILWLYASVITRLTEFFIGMKFSIELFFVTDYVGYFLLGYYLYQFEITKRWRTLSYCGLIIGLVGTFALTYVYTINGEGGINDFWYSYFSPTVLLCAIGLFILFKYQFNKKSLPFLFKEINRASLGIYIIHYWLLNNYLWKTLPKVDAAFNPLLAIPVNIAITFALSTVIISVIQRIPVIKKLVP
ncbi:acyltransferase [Fredinandcohnia onubensis]|uniref:acyltransferase n=1 Tax=Fredinandcohnia onubensis TaxID=1571209 RepID=UPI000C0BD3CA|nr:acyltransferase family protein [Fredinandcohnia onubensis]